ncbi:MAG: DUF1801 domain-containing protein [Alphaproteobacteria bacterium]
MQNYDAKDVEAYIKSAADDSRPKLKELQELIRRAIPEVEEGIGWGVPIYKYHGVLAGFTALKHHVNFGLVTLLQTEDREALEAKGYKTGKKTVQIRFDQKVPAAAIRRILKAQAKLNKAKKAKK